VPTGATTYEQAFANFLLGNVATFSQASTDVTPDIRAQQWETYAQDDWRVKPNFTLNMGVRYSLFASPSTTTSSVEFRPCALQTSERGCPDLRRPACRARTGRLYQRHYHWGGNSPYGSKISNPGFAELRAPFRLRLGPL